MANFLGLPNKKDIQSEIRFIKDNEGTYQAIKKLIKYRNQYLKYSKPDEANIFDRRNPEHPQTKHLINKTVNWISDKIKELEPDQETTTDQDKDKLIKIIQDKINEYYDDNKAKTLRKIWDNIEEFHQDKNLSEAFMSEIRDNFNSSQIQRLITDHLNFNIINSKDDYKKMINKYPILVDYQRKYFNKIAREFMNSD